MIWKLSDLSSQTAIISLFLFGAAFQSHWKTSVGSVVAILNPDIVPNKEVNVILFVVVYTVCFPLAIYYFGFRSDFTLEFSMLIFSREEHQQ